MDSEESFLRKELRRLTSEVQELIGKIHILKMEVSQMKEHLEEINCENKECQRDRNKLFLAVNGLSMKVGFIVVIAIFVAEWAWKLVMHA